MMDILQDTMIWLVISFLLFTGILWKFGKSALLKMLDARIHAIQEELKVAENLRIEAQELFAQYQRKHRDAEKEAERMIALAEKQAEDVRKKAEADLDSAIARREAQLKERLARMEQDAKEEIRQYAATLALEATQQIIAKKLDSSANENLIKASIQSVEKNFAA